MRNFGLRQCCPQEDARRPVGVLPLHSSMMRWPSIRPDPMARLEDGAHGLGYGHGGHGGPVQASQEMRKRSVAEVDHQM